MKTRGVILGILVLVVAPVLLAEAGSVWVITLSTTIDYGTVTYVQEAVRAAEEADATMLVIELDTPGGLLEAATRCRSAVLGTQLPTVAYVNPEAFSAGAMIAIACDTILFAPGGAMGAATPVYDVGETYREAPEKTISAVRTLFRSSAETNGRPPDVAEAMVDRDVAIPGLIEAGKLLTLSSDQALAWGYSDGEIESLSDWLVQAGHPDEEIFRFKLRWIDDLVNALTSPIGVAILIIIGILGLITEMLMPGFGIPGLIGIACLGAFFWSHVLVGLAGWESVAFLIGGILAILLEIFAFTAVDFGITGLAGLVLVGLGFYTAMVGPFTERAEALRAIGVVSIGVFVGIVAAIILITKLPKTRLRLGGMILSSAISSRAFGSANDRKADAWVGRTGTAATDLHPVGIGVFGGKRVDVVSDGSHIPRGAAIEIVKDDGYRKVVQQVRE